MPQNVTYYGPHEAVDLPALGVTVAHGESVEVPDDVADRLVEQGWSSSSHADTVTAVLDRVAGDPDQARMALAAETAKSNPRKTLVASLEEILDADAATDPATDQAAPSDPVTDPTVEV